MDRHQSTTSPESVRRAIAFAIVLGAAASCAGCGGATTSSDGGVPPSGDRGANDAGGNPAYFGSVNSIGGGFTYVGNWIFDPGARGFHRPAGCSASGDWQTDSGNRRLFVPPYWLQVTPVTNRLYGLCVTAGACTPPDHDIGDPNPLLWDDPARTELPVYGRYDQAAAYCSWARGRLPSAAELIRAAQGDEALPGVKGMTEAAVDCFTPGSSGAGQPICGQLMLMFYDQIPSPALYRVDGLPLDHGPFGNADVFGSVWQWTRTFIEQLPGDKFCNLPDGAPDFVTFPQTSGSPSHSLVHFATSIIQAVQGKNLAYRILTVAPDYTNRYNLGFRCAFDQNPYTLQ